MKPNITKNKSKGVKINVDYNDDGIEIGDGSIQLVSLQGPWFQYTILIGA